MTLQDLKDCVLVFDVDGVLVRYNFRDEVGGFRLRDQSSWIQANAKYDLYSSAEGTIIFDNIIKENKYEVYILSVAFTSFEQNSKIKYLTNRFSNLKAENIIFVGDKAIKVEMMKFLREKLDNDGLTDVPLVLIEDTVSTMIDVESMHNDMIRCHLVSDFI